VIPRPYVISKFPYPKTGFYPQRRVNIVSLLLIIPCETWVWNRTIGTEVVDQGWATPVPVRNSWFVRPESTQILR